MKPRQWQLIALAGSILLFAVTIITISVFVSNRRAARDLRFGIEELDLLIEDAVWEEALAMLPWLAERSRTAGEGLRVARRAREVARRSGNNNVFARVAEVLSDEFPGNTALRELAIYALVGARQYESAFEQSKILLEQTGDDLFFAWTLLLQEQPRSPGAGFDPPVSDKESASMLVATLDRESPVQEFTRAWELSGRWEYAHLASLLAMSDGNPELAGSLVEKASLTRLSPLLAYDVLIARGDFAGAGEALGNGDQRTPVLMRAADLALYTARFREARELYARLMETEQSIIPYQAFINRAWLSPDRQAQADLLDEAVDRFPNTWPVREQAVRFWSQHDPLRAVSLLGQWSEADTSGRAGLLSLRVGRAPGRGFDAALWQLLEGDPPMVVQRYAAWYFAGAGTREDLARVVQRANPPDAPWVGVYHGILLARDGRWELAADEFRQSFRLQPSAATAFNLAISETRLGFLSEARERLEDALILSAPDSRVRVEALLALARLEPDRLRARAYLQEAKAIRPNDPRVLLLEQSAADGSSQK